MSKKQILLTLFVLFTFFAAKAQDAEVRGFLTDESTGEPVLFVNVYLAGTTMGASTDVNGYYSISNIPPGDYQLVVQAIGYDSASQSISLKAKQILTQSLSAKPVSQQLETVEIRGNAVQKTTQVNAGVTKITPRDILIVPAIGGEPDLAQYISTMPGVVFTGDQGGQLYIRGGAPVQNLVLLDGLIVYNPFHSIGLFSVFDTDILKNVDIYTGGFNAEYGGRANAVIDARTRDGNKRRFAGKLSANTFTSKINLEGPIRTGENGSSTTFVASARTSYLDRSSKIFYDNVEGGLPYSFTDFYGKITNSSSNGSKVSLYGFNFTDKAELGTPSNFSWNNFGVGASFIFLPGTSSTLMDGNIGYSNYGIEIIEETAAPRSSSVNSFNLGLNFTYFTNRNEVKYGISLVGNDTEFIGYGPTGIKDEEKENNTELGGFVKYRINKTKFILEPSVRLQYYASLNNMRIEPRLGAKYKITTKLRLKAAAGIYSQNLISTRSDRDVVNLFNGFLSTPQTLVDVNGQQPDSKLQTSTHLITGVEYDLTPYLEVNVEPYVKYFGQVINLNRQRIFQSDPTFVIEEGLARGVDFLLRYDRNSLYLQGSYSLAQVERTYGDFKYPPNYDRRHNINMLGAYQFGKERVWEFTARWNYGSGFPFTQTQGFYEQLNFPNGPSSDVGTENGDLGIIYAELNGGRLPIYHRLDISLKRTFELSENSEIQVTASIINVYNRENLFYVDRVNNKVVNQLPFLPSLGASWSF